MITKEEAIKLRATDGGAIENEALDTIIALHDEIAELKSQLREKSGFIQTDGR